MKTTLYYFTGTGNSLKIAKDLATKLENSELKAIAKEWEKEKIESDSTKVGFIFPLYWSGLPKIVYDFISKIDLSKANYCFTVITSAGDINEQPLQQLVQILSTKAKKLNAGFLITMPSNYILGDGITPEEEQRLLFKNTEEQVENIATVIKNEKDNLTQDVLNKDLSRSRMINENFRAEVCKSDRSFYADEKCTSCGVCEEVCPVNNIKLNEGKPQWQHKCQQCLACINFCPEEAIQFDTKTINMGRYHHPEITLKEIVNQKK